MVGPPGTGISWTTVLEPSQPSRNLGLARRDHRRPGTEAIASRPFQNPEAEITSRPPAAEFATVSAVAPAPVSAGAPHSLRRAREDRFGGRTALVGVDEPHSLRRGQGDRPGGRSAHASAGASRTPGPRSALALAGARQGPTAGASRAWLRRGSVFGGFVADGRQPARARRLGRPEGRDRHPGVGTPFGRRSLTGRFAVLDPPRLAAGPTRPGYASGP